MAAPFLTMRQQVAAKIEVTEGTANAPAATADVIAPAYDVEYTPNFEVPEREVIQPSFSRISSIAGERTATISFATEVKGSTAAGTAPQNLSVPLQICGFSETIVGGISVTYAPASASIPSATVDVRELEGTTVAKIKRIVGARGTVTFTAEKGNIVLAQFELTGRYVEPTEGVVLTGPAITPNPLPFLSAGISVQGAGALKLQSWSLDMQNTVTARNDVNEASGNFSAVITGRNPIGEINPEQELIATKNFYNDLTTNVEGSLTWTLTGAAGNITTFTAPKTQIVALSEDDDEGIRRLTLGLKYNQDTAAGDDEISLAFT
jgi:hypothetical protein